MILRYQDDTLKCVSVINFIIVIHLFDLSIYYTKYKMNLKIGLRQ